MWFKVRLAMPLVGMPLVSIVAVVSALDVHAAPTVDYALKLSPLQPGVECDVPTAEEAKGCKISPEKIGVATAWVVRGPQGGILRQFIDSNNDNVVDTWCYFRGGMEVYRDIDANFNNKADQYRWFHTAGSRWGLDRNEDGKVDAWKAISAEEAAEEAVVALRTKDPARFARLLLAKDEIAQLGLPKPLADKLAERTAAAVKTFAALQAAGTIDAKAEFTDFGGARPGAVPAGARGGSKDLLVYEDVWAMVLTGGKHEQLQLGSMVELDGAWRLIDGPALGDASRAVAGFFYDTDGVDPQSTAATLAQPNDQMQKILEAIESLDKQFATAAPDKKPALNAQRADQLEKLAGAASTPAEREQWIKQFADMLSATSQDGSYPKALERIGQLEAKLAKEKASEDLLAHVEFRRMQAVWGQAVADPKADYAKVQEAWLKQLEDFVAKHKGGEHVAEALYQLANANEYPPGEVEAAKKWYERFAADFPQNPLAAKARGAVRRLTCVGAPIALKGTAIDGAAVDLAQYRGKAVVIHYWSTSAPSCKDDHERLLELYEKYGGAKFDVIGVSLDASKEEVAAYLKEQKLPWKQLFEPGGFDSRPANEMGVITLPMLILVNAEGQGVNANIMTGELEPELKKLLAPRVAAAK